MAFDLSSISKTRRLRAPKVVIYGPGKIGKTTFAASAPNAIGILTEEGADAVDASAFPLCSTLDDVYAAIATLLNEEHEFQSVFLDSLDWLEPLVHAAVCKRLGVKNIEEPGYGKGYVAATDEWRQLLAGFDALRNQKGLAVILIGHDQVKRFEDPLHPAYDVYSLKLHQKASALVMEWADVIGFANYKVMTRETTAGFGQKQVKAIGTGQRVLYLNSQPAFVAGNRFSLPDIGLSWAEFVEAIQPATAVAA